MRLQTIPQKYVSLRMPVSISRMNTKLISPTVTQYAEHIQSGFGPVQAVRPHLALFSGELPQLSRDFFFDR
jgi:hypothetical protein